MNKAQAIALVKEQGATVTKITKFESSREGFNGTRVGQEFFVNGKRISHDGFGGSAEWKLEGKTAGYGNVVDCILGAVGINSYRGSIR